MSGLFSDEVVATNRRHGRGCAKVLAVLVVLALLAIAFVALIVPSSPISDDVRLPRNRHAVLIADGSDAGAIEAAARKVCDGQTFCQVFGWKQADAAYRGTSSPFTKAQSDRMVFRLTLDGERATDLVQFKCGSFAGVPAGTCF